MIVVGVLLIGLLLRSVSADVQPQEFNVQYGTNPKILELMRQLGQAQKSGDFQLAAQLKETLANARDQAFDELEDFETECKISAYFDAEIFIADFHHPHPRLDSAMKELDEFWRTDDGDDLPYPGDFETFMLNGQYRIIRVDYEELPWPVKKWRDEQFEKKSQDRKLIAVVDGVAFFSPGVMNLIKPLFAGKDVVAGKNECEDQLLSIDNYGKKDSDVKFIANFLGKSEVGTSLRIKTVAEKRTKKSLVDKVKDEL